MEKLLVYWECVVAVSYMLAPYASAITVVRIPPAMSLDDLRREIVGSLVEEAIYIQPNPGDYVPFAAARMYVTDRSSDVFDIRISGEELSENGERVCSISTYTYRSMTANKAEFLSADGGYWGIFSSCPACYVWVLHCVNWEEGSSECTSDRVYINLYLNYQTSSPIDINADLALMGIRTDNRDFSFYYNLEDPEACHYGSR